MTGTDGSSGMDNDTPSQDSLPHSSLLRRGPDQVPARGELVWNEDGGVTNAATQTPRASTAQDLDPEPLPHAVTEETPTEVIDATAGALAAELARRRTDGRERIDTEMRTRRAKVIATREHQR